MAPNRAKLGKRVRVRRKATAAATRSHASRVLAQGVGATPAKAFGDRLSANLAVWDAKLPAHLPLPRAVGAYTVIRTTRVISTDESIFFGTFQVRNATQAEQGNWTSACALSAVMESNPVNGAGNTRVWTYSMTGVGGAAQVVPSAISVQVMNDADLLSAGGIMYAAVMNTQANYGGESRTYNTLFQQFLQYQNPRILSGGKLALRGVQANSYPLNMSECSKFTRLEESSDGTTAWDEHFLSPVGWAPIMFYNPNSKLLQFLVTTEWRIRFDLSSPAAASHTHHPVASDSVWNTLMTKATSMGHGVLDISEKLANVGAAYEIGKQAYANLSRAAPLLELVA